MAREAWPLGARALEEASASFLPCRLAARSAVTVVGTARAARPEYIEAERRRERNGAVMVAQFAVELRGLHAADGEELRGLHAADGEEPPRILHLNPRLRGDRSGRPVLEMNTCFRMQWGRAQRCDGTPSKDDDRGTTTSRPVCAQEALELLNCVTTAPYDRDRK